MKLKLYKENHTDENMEGEFVFNFNTCPYSNSYINIYFSKFFLVPEVQRKNKPLITYVGDSVVLVCKCRHCAPLNWTWYSGNRSVQVRSYFCDLKKTKFIYL